MDRAPIVLPIRFAAGDTAVQTTTRELSERGVLVRCMEPPPAGTPVSLKLYLPGAREALLVKGVVQEHANSGEPGFWAPCRASTAEALFKKCSNIGARRLRVAR